MGKERKQFFLRKLLLHKLSIQNGIDINKFNDLLGIFLNEKEIDIRLDNNRAGIFYLWSRESIIGDLLLSIFHKRSFKKANDIPMYNFLHGMIDESKLNSLKEERHDFLIFISIIKKTNSNKKIEVADIYVVSSGYGYNAIDNAIDYEFPLQIAAKMINADALKRVALPGFVWVNLSKN